MAALAATKRVEAQIRAKEKFEKFENRFSNYGAFNAFRASADALLPAGQLSAQRSAQNTTDIAFPVLNKQSLTVITSNACTFTGQDPVSAKPTFSDIWRGFAIKAYKKVGRNNNISYEEQYANGVVNGIRSVLANLDSYAVTQLEAFKSTGLVTSGLTGVTTVSNAYRIALAQADKVYTYAPVLMALNDLEASRYLHVMNTEGKARMIDFESRATGNDVNLAGILNGSLPSAAGYQHFTSNRLTNGAGVAETHYLAPLGHIGVFTSIDSDAIDGLADGDSKMYVETDGIIGVTWGVTEELICDDLSATYGAGYEACHGTQWRFMAKFSFMQAYSSDTTKPVHKIEIASA